jgi:hypothetical protein
MYGSSRSLTNSGRKIPAAIAPAMEHTSQLGKSAPAILITGSHPESASAQSANALTAAVNVQAEVLNEQIVHKRRATFNGPIRIRITRDFHFQF